MSLNRIFVIITPLLLCSTFLFSQEVGIWAMDNNGLDMSGNNYHSTLNGNPAFTSAAQIGSHALVLDGNDDFLDLTNHISDLPQGNNARTIAGWFNANGGQQQSFFSYGNDSSGSRISITADASLVAVAVNGHNWGLSNLNLTGWHHVAIVFPQGASTSSQFKIYINGVEQNPATLAGSPKVVNTGSTFAYIGRSHGQDYYTGSIDDLRVYSSDLSASDIQNLIGTSDAIGVWSMDNNGLDMSGNNYHSTLNGNPTFTSAAQVGSHALVLDGNDDFLDLTNHINDFPQGNNPRTITGWFNANGQQQQSFFSYGMNTTGRRFSFTADGSSVAVAVNGHNWGVSGLNLSGWHHAAAVLPAGSSNSNDIKIYLDGVEKQANTLAGSPVAINTGNTYAHIGRSNNSAFYQGSIDDVRLYDKDLSASEIKQLASSNNNSNDYTLTSPDGSLVVTVTDNEQNLSYKVVRNGITLVNTSNLSIRNNSTHQVMASSTNSVNSNWTPTWEQFSTIQDRHNSLTLDLSVDGIQFDLIFKAFNDGIGFRFEAGQQAALTGSAVDFNVQYKLNNNYQGYYPAGENDPVGPVAIQSLSENPLVPFVMDGGSDGFVALMESDLYSADDFRTITFNRIVGQPEVQSNMTVNSVSNGQFVTPWRIVLVGDSPGDLIVSTTPVNLAAPLASSSAANVTPGKCTWDWRVIGYTANDGFTYDIDTESSKRFIDFAKDNNIEYHLVDDGWYSDINANGVATSSSDFDVNEVVQYAENSGVKLGLYFDRKKHVNNGASDTEIFNTWNNLGASLIKYGFRGNNAGFTRSATLGAANEQLGINFHDNPSPMTGLHRTLPNALSREVGHAQQDSRRAYDAEGFMKMAMINALTGPFDQTNGIYDIDGVTSRAKGPTNDFHSTVAGENARTLIIFSGLVVLPDAPEEYLAKADMFEFIKEMPVGRWDETIIPNSKMTDYITTARRSGNEWFVASATDNTARTLAIKLDFLDPGVTYDITYYEDNPGVTNAITNPEAYRVRTGTVTNRTTVQAQMVAGGGHSMWIRPVNTSSAITQPNVIVFLVDDMGTQDASEQFLYDENGNPLQGEFEGFYRTPNLENLADSGTKFSNAYAHSVCSPSRVSLITGMNAARHHVSDFTNGGNISNGQNSTPAFDPPPTWRSYGVDSSDITLPQLFKNSGYRTLFAGKAHFAANNSNFEDPTAIGFDVNIGGDRRGQPASYTNKFGQLGGSERLIQYNNNTFLTEALTLEINKDIEQAVADEVPFFAYMAHYAVHSPFTNDPRFVDNYPNAQNNNHRNYATMVEGIDKSLGDMMAKLEKLGVAENTLIVFLSDNGGDAPLDGWCTSCTINNSLPLKGMKTNKYEGGSRVPLVISWAKRNPNNPFQQNFEIESDARVDDMVGIYDIFPTVLKAADIEFGHRIDGHDLSAYLAGEAGVHRPQQIVQHYPHDHRSDYYSWLRDGDFKLIYDYVTGEVELFNLKEDIGESSDLSESEPQLVDEMLQKLCSQLNEHGAQYPVLVATGEEVGCPDVLGLRSNVDNDSNDKTLIFPNPNQGQLYVNLTKYLEDEVKLHLTDLMGKVHLSVDLEKDHAPVLEMDMTTFKNGMYLLYIRGENNQAEVEKISLINNH